MVAKIGEFAFIDWLRKQAKNKRVGIGIGDDAATLQIAGKCLITTDMLLDGTHFILSDTDPRLIGRKAMAVNLSDIAAMAGKPVAAVVALGLPKKPGSRRLAEELYLGMQQIGSEFDTEIIGGDTNSWDGPLVIALTLIGRAPGRPITRSGAKIGDWLLVTGPLGGSLLGRHLTFVPRVREALVLRAHAHLHSMIDISDGLAADLGHICEESGCGAVLFESQIPIASGTIKNALYDGEDFELLFSVSKSDGERLLSQQPLHDMGGTLSLIGECITGGGIWLEHPWGRRQKIESKGYVHWLK